MKLVILYISVILIITSNAFSQDSQDSTVYHSLNITCNAGNVKILIDTVNAGSAPLKDYKIEEGTHTIILYNPASANNWQIENYRRDVKIISDTTISINFERYYFINSDPFNSNVFLNDTLLGQTPLRLYRESPLSGNLTFKKDEYVDKTINLDPSDTSNNILVKLKEKRYGQTDPIVFRDKKTDFKSSRNILAIGSFGAGALLSGISAIYHKNLANESYDKYQQSFNPGDLNKTNRNDTISLVSLILMQGAVAGLIYYLFFD